ncbi:DMT family transporter [Chitinophaga ginsengisoli]|uniref:Guanidinium exporter n=1 Tax=Chitinophaga ginsengisoli TaxID=363837 RepID=A0A2P8GNM4_9BACT|nr:SMR family transporter [Chitinophaga ginsengisoli]PSL35561.1 quaternary ammonium compound-resistance protein SugE [Chitinophaga ginsengisoli]
MAWVYIFIATIMEIAWTFCVKFMDIKKIGAIRWSRFFSDGESVLLLLPLLGYIVFGLSNVYFFSLSLKQIPMSVALAVWMGIVLVGTFLLEVLLLKQSWQVSQLFFMGLILVGVIGLKTSIKIP